jgi:small-conductance mechanosensitive channel
MDEWLREELVGNAIWRWLAAAAVAVVTVAAVRLAKALLRRRLSGLAARTETRADDIAVEVIERTRWFFYLGLGLYLGSRLLELEEGVEDGIAVAATLVLLLQVGLWGRTAIRRGVEAWQERHGPELVEEEPGRSTMAAGLVFIGNLLLWTFVLLMALNNLGIEITTLVAGLGMGGIAAALAVQSVLGDLFASLSIYFDRPFDIGDFVIVGDLMGTVDKIGLRSTRIRSLGGEQLVFSNEDLLESRIRNYERMQERRVVQVVGVTYGTPAERLEKAPELMRAAVEEDGAEAVRFDRAHFKRFADYSLELELVYWVLSPDYTAYMDVQQAINFGIMRRFEAAGLDFAFPTRTLHVHHESPHPLAREREPRRGNGAGAPAH